MEPIHNGKPISFYRQKALKGQRLLRKKLGAKGYSALKAKGMKGKTWTVIDGRRIVQDLPISK